MIKAFTQTVNRLAARFSQFINSLQLRKIAALASVALILLTTSVDNSSLEPNAKAALNDMIARGENGRPVTTGQWQAENEALQGKPAMQAERIAKESADAIGEMAEIYPGNIKTVVPGLSNDSLEKDD